MVWMRFVPIDFASVGLWLAVGLVLQFGLGIDLIGIATQTVSDLIGQSLSDSLTFW